jgi:hypothetical protein
MHPKEDLGRLLSGELSQEQRVRLIEDWIRSQTDSSQQQSKVIRLLAQRLLTVWMESRQNTSGLTRILT